MASSGWAVSLEDMCLDNTIQVGQHSNNLFEFHTYYIPEHSAHPLAPFLLVAIQSLHCVLSFVIAFHDDGRKQHG
jgi:hypothetical protein